MAKTVEKPFLLEVTVVADAEAVRLNGARNRFSHMGALKDGVDFGKALGTAKLKGVYG